MLFLADQVSPVDIDDINLAPGYCSAVISCNFDIDMCGWTRDWSHNWVWDHGIGRVENAKALPSRITKPPKDQDAPTSGMYMYSDYTQMDERDEDDPVMYLLSEYVPATTGACLTFYYLPLNVNQVQFSIVLENMEGQLKSMVVSEYFLCDKFYFFLPRTKFGYGF